MASFILLVRDFLYYEVRDLTDVLLQLAFVQLGGAIATGVESKEAVFNSKFLGRKSYITTGVSLTLLITRKGNRSSYLGIFGNRSGMVGVLCAMRSSQFA